MTVVGIDKIGFYTPGYVLDLVALAKARGDEPDKYTIGIGQDYQAVIPPNEDIVTMGANAAKQIIDDQDRQKIDMVIVATESGIDNSKSSAMYIQRLLGLSEFSRTIEMKQACYAGTYGLMQARDYVTLHPEKRVLVIAADIARYGLATPGEVTQGGGAVAMIVAANPKILSINHDSVYMSRDVMDFWRPLDRSEAIVDGHLSTDVYKEMFMTLWQRYVQQNHKSIDELSAFVFHLPYTKMGKKALLQILPQATEQQQSLLMNHLQESQRFSRQVGNLYTGSVYLSLLSLLCHASDLQSGDDIAVFSYGSGAEAELYSVTLQPNFEEYVPKTLLHDLLEKRQVVSVATYEDIFKQQLTRSQIDTTTAMRSTGYNLLGIQDGMRIYE
ncbi:hydroxymethylglutaryl-CoA synthase [Leuconostoc fallax]|uniref:hydroxymethylglutaryl-CoA synthase n=1 Tax=Leuconostoc fallax TaxID=1251 RepID=UPI0020900BD2|nr:hydroxymethylglutaryl-CoA synthase [Leuconostoc fallax]MCO6183858.1 hydroxymethylglutaryl-CoA synthase [Leuconostoc fallax]